jgi:hypothetical protein
VSDAQAALHYLGVMGGPPPQAAMSQVQSMKNAPVTGADIRRAIDIYGIPASDTKSRAVRRAVQPARADLGPAPVQIEQTMQVDLFFVKKTVHLVAIALPLDLAFVLPLQDKSAASIALALKVVISKCLSRGFVVRILRCDNEKGIKKQTTVTEVQRLGIELDFCGAGEHCPEVERRIRWIKEKYRRLEQRLPYLMSTTLIHWAVRASARFTNMQRTASSTSASTPRDKFLGRPFDFKLDARVAFGAYVQTVVRQTDNTPMPRTEGCIALMSSDNLTGTIYAYHIATRRIVLRDQFTINPIDDRLIAYLDGIAEEEGYSRGVEPFDAGEWEAPADIAEDGQPVDPTFQPGDHDQPMEVLDPEPPIDQMEVLDPEPPIDTLTVPLAARSSNLIPSAIPDVRPTRRTQTQTQVYQPEDLRRPYAPRVRHNPIDDPADPIDGLSGILLTDSNPTSFDQSMSRHLMTRKNWLHKDFAFTISVKAAIREHGEAGMTVMEAELRQFVTKKMLHPVLMGGLSRAQRMRIIPSKMFLKEKFFPDGTFDKMKARLVAGGHRQDRTLYGDDDTTAPTAAHSSVMSVAAIAACENRSVAVCDIGGAFLNAKMPSGGVKVLVRVDKLLSAILCRLYPDQYLPYRTDQGELVVELDKAMYGCVESARLWYNTIRATLVTDMGFVENPYDPCVFNRDNAEHVQCTIVLHVDDMLITCADPDTVEAVIKEVMNRYPESKYTLGPKVPYLGMDLDFTVPGECRITMDGMIDDILAKCGVDGIASTPATEELFNVNPACPETTLQDRDWFHQQTAKMLYVSKRVRPECLTTVAFLATRVTKSDMDDLAKLKRLLKYLRSTAGRGICLRPGVIGTQVRAYIDAAYGVHVDGKSHTGCAITIGDSGPVFVKSGKQSIVTKSSTEAELVATSDSAGQAFHVRNFVIAQSHADKPAELLQDNLSCMALLAKGKSTAMRTRHIQIRYFWITDRVKMGEGVLTHLSTELMGPANILTKPLQGAQFLTERRALTNWD